MTFTEALVKTKEKYKKLYRYKCWSNIPPSDKFPCEFCIAAKRTCYNPPLCKEVCPVFYICSGRLFIPLKKLVKQLNSGFLINKCIKFDKGK